MSTERPFVPFFVFRCPYAWSSSHYYYLNFLHYCPELIIFYVTDLHSYQPLLIRDLVGFYFWWGGGDLVTNSWLCKEKKQWTRNMISRFDLQIFFFIFLFLRDIGFKEIDTLGTVWSGFRWALLIKCRDSQQPIPMQRKVKAPSAMLKFYVWTLFFVLNDLVGIYIHILWTSICRSRRPHPVEALTNRVITWDNLTRTGVIYNCISWSKQISQIKL